MNKSYKRSSETLLDMAQNKNFSGDVTYLSIIQALGERAFGLALLFFSLPSALPFSVIPGVSAIFSIPIMIFSFQMIISKKTLWLPNILAKRIIHHETISRIIQTTVPYLIKAEYFLKPRWQFMTSRFMEIVNGTIIFGLAILLMLPIPFSNFILATLLIIFSLGLIEKDGLFIAIGYVAVIIYAGFIYLVIMAGIKNLFN